MGHRLEREVDPGHDRDSAARHAEVDRKSAPNSSETWIILDPVGPDGEREEAAAAEQVDREDERVVLRCTGRNAHPDRGAVEGDVDPGRKGQVLREKTPTPMSGRARE